jgi:hypothetical protein
MNGKLPSDTEVARRSDQLPTEATAEDLRKQDKIGAVSSVGRAPARQAGGHWFEPSTAHLKSPGERGFLLLCAATVVELWQGISLPRRSAPRHRRARSHESTSALMPKPGFMAPDGTTTSAITAVTPAISLGASGSDTCGRRARGRWRLSRQVSAARSRFSLASSPRQPMW